MDDLDIIFIVGEEEHWVFQSGFKSAYSEKVGYRHLNMTRNRSIGVYNSGTLDMLFLAIPNVTNIFCNENGKLVVQYEID